VGSGSDAAAFDPTPVVVSQSKVSSVRWRGPGDRALIAPACRSSGGGLLPFATKCRVRRRQRQTRAPSGYRDSDEVVYSWS
jgi:hypothetical protein